MKLRVLTAVVVAGILVLGMTPAAVGQVVHQPDDEVVTPANSLGPGVPMFGQAIVRLDRSQRGISLKGTAFVTPEHAYTVWWIVFGTDENGDAEPPVVLNATGGVSTITGELHFSAGLRVGTYVEGVIPELVFLGGEVDEPLTAPVLLHILDHGPPFGGRARKQISDLSTGAPGHCLAGCPLATEIFIPSP